MLPKSHYSCKSYSFSRGFDRASVQNGCLRSAKREIDRLHGLSTPFPAE